MSMVGRTASLIAVLAILSVISVPAQQPASSVRLLSGFEWLVLSTPAVPAFGGVQGAVLNADHSRYAHALVRLRDARAGLIVGTLQADYDGFFNFEAVHRGNYVVELLADPNTVLATSPLLTFESGDIVQTVVRAPTQLDYLTLLAGFADTHASAVRTAAATSGILAVTPGDHVSPR